MLVPGLSFLNRPVMSLQTGTELARTASVIIDPRNLNVLAYRLEGPLLESPDAILMVRDIREVSSFGLIVDSSDEFMLVDDIINVKTVTEFNFSLQGIKVIDQKKRNLGKVINYSIDPATYQIEQLRIKRPLIKSLNDTEVLVNRNQIVEVQNDVIIVKSETAQAPTPILSEARAYTNPFRSSAGPTAQPESSTTQ